MIDMVNELLLQFTGGKFPRALGRPYRCNNFGEYYIVNSIEEIEEHIKNWNETNCYMSVYSYTEYNQENRNKMSAVIDCIPFDFDDKDNPENALSDAKKLLAWCTRHNITPRISFSGSKGAHIFIDLEPIELNHTQEVLKRFAKEINKAAGFKSLDYIVIGDLERVIRIPNTKHKTTGMYCLPLNPKLFPFLSLNSIHRLACNKSTYVPIRTPIAGEIHQLLHEYDDIIDEEIKEMQDKIKKLEEMERRSLFPGLSSGVPCICFKEYMANGAEEGERDIVLVGCIHKLKGDGFTKDKIFRELLEFGSKCNPPLQESYIKSRLDSHFKKSYSLCTFFSKASSICDVCPNKKF